MTIFVSPFIPGVSNVYAYRPFESTDAAVVEKGETEIELDVIALCCDYSEHESALDCIEDLGYGFEPEPEDTEESTNEEAALEYLRENTQVITFEGGIIIQGF